MVEANRRMARESRTIETMIGMYCRGQHGDKRVLCKDCQDLLEYARQRLSKCPFQDNKPTCAKCSVHCYNPEMRESVRMVMRYAGPRMSYRHPVQALLHFLDDRRKTPIQHRGG